MPRCCEPRQFAEPFEFGRTEMTPLPGRESANADVSDGGPPEFPNRMAHGRAHPLHLAFPSLAKRELYERGILCGSANNDFGGRCGTIVEGDALREAGRLGGGHRSDHPRKVNPVDLMLRVHEPVGKLAVVGEDEGALDVHVQPSHREYAFVDP